MKIPRIESILVVVFFLSVTLWMISKCNDKRAVTARHQEELLEDEEKGRRAKRRDTTKTEVKAAPKPTVKPEVVDTPVVKKPTTLPKGVMPKLKEVSPEKAQTTTTTASKASDVKPETYPTLYVVIDGLNVRSEPNPKAVAVATLKLNDKVFFLNKKTEWTQEINLDGKKTTDHWVKIRTKSGKEGWVFGAGVHYYKK
ncbi:MAG: SH3 domain-containing protein [Saprospiraceae bacterium]|nr:SH3 domain-containing protein [Saprospiraceae bacterium]